MTAEVLSTSAVQVGAEARSQDEAIDKVGALLVAEGLVTVDYVGAMHAREAIVSTYLGNGIALPHGTNESQGAVRRTASTDAWKRLQGADHISPPDAARLAETWATRPRGRIRRS